MVELIKAAARKRAANFNLQLTVVGDAAAIDSCGAKAGRVGTGDIAVVTCAHTLDVAGQCDRLRKAVAGDVAIVD